jgi:hypothetical protein
MPPVIQGYFGVNRRGWMKYRMQEPGGGGTPDVQRPPDQDVPEIGRELPDPLDDDPASPPFTGEDVEDADPSPNQPNLPM